MCATTAPGPDRIRQPLSTSTDPDRKAERPAAHLERFRGILQVDGYAGFETLAEGGEVVLAACWAHARRKFYDFHQATGSPIAAEALRRIAELYAVEKRIRGQSAEVRQRARDAESRPLIAAMKPWLEDQLRRVPPRGGLAAATMRSRAGRPCADSSTTAASSSTTTPSSAPSGPWR
jgi:hypothetical protein